jgi:predicted secreted Zn-dependent protease
MVIKSSIKTADLLKHEQGHFDITVLTVRAFAKELEQLKAGSPAALGQQVNAALSKHQQRANMLEEKYDKETDHSRDQDAQKKWNQAIDSAMKGSGVLTLQGMPL